ncbi:calbindin-32-like isoform X2 [Clytia hemisphaerica]|uniref:EF-hand domain-containing protein n=2 Tax=Clytia hemisphaerica TaxID=252671 RepID=A0A7M5VDA8_9CNID
MSIEKESFLQDIRQEELHVVDFMKLWFKYDKNKDGYLQKNEMEDFLREMLEKKGKVDRLEEYYKSCLSNFDLNHDGLIELREFALIVPVEKNYLEQFSESGAFTVEEYTKVFQHYDRDNNQYIEKEELVSFLRDLRKTQDEEPTTTDLEVYKGFILQCCDSNKDGRISFTELKLLLVG